MKRTKEAAKNRGTWDINKTSINGGLKLLTYPFKNVFSGFEKTEAVKGIFGRDARKVLSKLRVLLFNSPIGGYMYIDEKEGVLCCNLDYLRNGDKRGIYLDVIHELVHVRQLMEGLKLFDEQFEYIERPTELEAYRVAVAEARRIGMGEKELREYLDVEWLSKKEFSRFLKKLGIG